MEPAAHIRTTRTRGPGINDPAGGGRRPHSRNKQWVAIESDAPSGRRTPSHVDGERWERGGHRGGRGTRGIIRGGVHQFPNASLRIAHSLPNSSAATTDGEDHHGGEGGEDEESYELEDQDPDTPEEREKFYQELVKMREVERKKAIVEGKMDDPLVPKRLEDAISIVGTCKDMCPRFERYRRERENNLFEWETIPGTKRVDHKRAVKMYERAAGDKTIPSDLRPPLVLQRTLDYLFHDLLPRGGFSQTFNFIRDRSRAVRNDFTMQHNTGPLAIECHDRCARFHILALHFERDRKGFSIALEEQQLMNTLQSLKEFYEDQRGRYESPTELEMRVYHRLIHIRDQKERHEDIPDHITSHPVFKLTTDFRVHVQQKSAPISKTSALVVDAQGMQIFGELANVLRQQGSVVMIYLVACLLERLFGKETIDDIEAIRGDLEIPDIIDGVSSADDDAPSVNDFSEGPDEEMLEDLDENQPEARGNATAEHPFRSIATESLPTTFGPTSTTSTVFGPPAVPASSTRPASAFSTLAATPNVFNTSSVFGKSAFTTSSDAPTSVFSVDSSRSVGQVDHLETPTTVTTAGPPSPLVQPSGSNSFSLANSNIFASTSSSQFAPAISNPFAPMTVNSFAPTPTSTFPTTTTSPLSTFRAPSSFTGASELTVPPLVSTLPFGGPQLAFSKPITPATANAPTSNGVAPAGATASTALSPGSTPPTLNPRAYVFTPTTPLNQPLSSFSETSKPDGIPTDTISVSQPPMQAINGFSQSVTTSSTFSFTPAETQLEPPPIVENAAQSKSQPAWGFPRTSATPPLPKINTNPNPVPTIPDQGLFSPSPVQPPRLAKKQPISLPSTPTVQPPNPLLDMLKNNLETSVAHSSSGILSPLYLPSPTTSGPSTVHNFSPNGVPKGLEVRAPPERPVRRPNGKGKDRATSADIEKLSTADQEAKALSQGAIDEIAWIEACRQSDAYRKKIRSQRSSHGLSPKKRRISTGLNVSLESPQKKRARRRVSGDYQPPRTDEALAQRFKENHEEHERRWAQGSFLQVIRTHVKTRTSITSLPQDWRIWLSMNPDSDATAIWLERKFDVPASGWWESDTVFSIPLSRNNASSSLGFPGVIIFECTPLEGVTDDLERKYRILDDCARLRDIIQALPPKRHFIPSLLVFCWAGAEQTDSPSDLLDMISKLVQELVLESHRTFSITSATTDLDQKFDEALGSLTLDVVGKLVQSVTLRDVFKLFELPFSQFISEWIENCSANGYFDWFFYGRVVQASVNLLNIAAQHVCRLTAAQSDFEPLPAINVHNTFDSESTYDIVLSWLAENLSPISHNVATDLQSHRDMGRDFPPRAFIDHLRDLAQYQTEVDIQRESNTNFHVPTVDIASALQQFQSTIRSQAVKLGHALNLSSRRSPRRRSLSEDTDIKSSIFAKRRKLSTSVDSNTSYGSLTPSPRANSHFSPSPSNNSTVSLVHPESPLVTVAMLRALTRDVKQKYGAT